MICENCGHEIITKKRYCMKLVPLSFAKSKLNTTFKRINGTKQRSEEDYIEYKKRFNKIINMQIGDFETIEGVREDGGYGNEYRDVLNFSSCRGLINKSQKNRIKEEKIELDYYEKFYRIKTNHCKFLKVETLKNGNKKLKCTLNNNKFE